MKSKSFNKNNDSRVAVVVVRRLHDDTDTSIIDSKCDWMKNYDSNDSSVNCITRSGESD